MKKCKRGHEYEASKKQCPLCKAESKKEWKLANADREHENQKAWYLANPDYQKAYYLANKEQFTAQGKKWQAANPERKRENKRNYQRNRKATDPLFKLADNIRSLINNSLRNKGHKKNSKAQTILGCDFETLQAHLIATAKLNYNGYWSAAEEYHVDHIIPLSSVTTEAEINKLNHYSNLRYLTPEHNLAKGDKLDWTMPIAISDSNN